MPIHSPIHSPIHHRPCIWLIGGTSDSATIAQQLSAQSLPYLVTVTTESAQRLYPANAHVQVAKLTPQTIERLVQQWQIKCILDASHPFASEISRYAMDCAQRRAITYLRYERTDISTGISTAIPNAIPSEPNQANEGTNVTLIDSIEALADSDLLKHQRVLFSLGYRHLKLFSSLRQTSTLFARVLPSSEAITGAIAAGFSTREIIALRPPISSALEAALWQQWNITCVVAKASGLPGGELTKRQIAQTLGVKLVLIQRPKMTYLAETDCLSEMVDFGATTLRRFG